VPVDKMFRIDDFFEKINQCGTYIGKQVLCQQ
jgi:hypothetical protein